MNLIPLHDEFFKESDHTTLEHPCPGCLSFPFLTVGQIDICNISIFVAWASYGKHSKKCTFYTLRFGCSFAAVNTIKPQLL